MKAIFTVFNRHFAKASLVAKFSLIVNIGLAYVMQSMRSNEGYLVEALIECHSSKYKDLNAMIVQMGILKEMVVNPEAKQKIDTMIEKSKKSMQ